MTRLPPMTPGNAEAGRGLRRVKIKRSEIIDGRKTIVAAHLCDFIPAVHTIPQHPHEERAARRDDDKANAVHDGGGTR